MQTVGSPRKRGQITLQSWMDLRQKAADAIADLHDLTSEVLVKAAQHGELSNLVISQLQRAKSEAYAAGGPNPRKSGGPNSRKSGGTQPGESGGSNQRRSRNWARRCPEDVCPCDPKPRHDALPCRRRHRRRLGRSHAARCQSRALRRFTTMCQETTAADLSTHVTGDLGVIRVRSLSAITS